MLWSIILALGKTLNIISPSDQISSLFGIPAGLALLLGPIPISVFGTVIGIILGLIWARHAEQKITNNVQ